MTIIKPKKLHRGATLGIVACSTPMTSAGEETIQRAYSNLRERGFHLIEAPNCRKTVGHSAGPIEERVEALHACFRNPDIHGILSFWGGFQSHQLLEYLDYDLIKNNPKPLIGFSDTTALQIGIFSQTGLVSFSGPAGITYGKPTQIPFSWEHFEKVVMHPEVPFYLGVSDQYSDNLWFLEPAKKMIFNVNPGWAVYHPGRTEGKILGGNLGTLLLLAGTKFWPNLEGSILFLEEDEEENPQTIDRVFTQLRQMGVFKLIRGIVVGRFSSRLKFKSTDSLEMIFKDALKGYSFPVITGVDFGHTDPLITIPFGIQCRIDTAKKEICYLESAVEV